jgi:hypothetical protein
LILICTTTETFTAVLLATICCTKGRKMSGHIFQKGQMSLGCTCNILEEIESPIEPRRDRWKLEQGRQLYFETEKLALLDFLAKCLI